MKKTIVLVSLLLAHTSLCLPRADNVVWFSVQDAPPPLLAEPLSLERALDIAYHNRSILHALDNTIKARKSSELEALSGYFPKFSLNSLVSQSQKQLNGELSFKKHQQFFNFEQLLYSFAGPLEQYQINQYTTAIARLQRNLKENAIQFEVEKNFLTLYSIHEKQKTIATLEKASRAQFARAKAQNSEQLLNADEWYKEKAAYATAIFTVDSYQEDRATTIATLNRSLETELLTPLNNLSTRLFIQASIAQATAHPLDFYIRNAFAYRKELAIQEEEIEQSKAQLRFFQRSYLPKFSFFTTIENGAISIPTSFWLLGIKISWEFDGLSSAYKAQEQKAAVESAIMAKKDTEQTITLEVQTAYLELQKLIKQLRAAYEEKERDRTIFTVKKKQYEIGELSAPDFSAACNDWENAQFVVTNLETIIAIKQRELLYSCGYPQTPPNEIG